MTTLAASVDSALILKNNNIFRSLTSYGDRAGPKCLIKNTKNDKLKVQLKGKTT